MSFVLALVAAITTISGVSIKDVCYWCKTRKASNAVSSLHAFEHDQYGIIVASFASDSQTLEQKAKQIQYSLSQTLNIRLRELQISNTKAELLELAASDVIQSHEHARRIGSKYNAAMVLWGDVTIAGVIPQITIVNKRSRIYQLGLKEKTVIKDSLAHAALFNCSDIRLPALTDETTLIVSFVTGLKYYDLKEYDKAFQCFSDSLKISPSTDINSIPILYQIGATLSNQRKHNEAIRIYENILRIDKRAVDALYNIAVMHLNMGQNDKALAVSEKGLKSYPNKHSLHSIRGIVYSRTGRYHDALKAFSKALELNPNDDGVYYNRSWVHSLQKNFNKAIDDASSAILLNPQAVVAYNNRASAYNNIGKYNHAIEDCNKALEIDDRFSLAYMNRANSYGALKNYNKAIEDYDRFLAISPNDAKAYCCKGIVYLEMGDEEKAVSECSKALTVNPKHVEANILLGIIYRDKKLYDKAITCIERVLEFDPQDEDGLINLGNCYFLKKDYEKALMSYSKIIDINADHISAHLNRGIIYSRLGNQEKALSDWGHAIRINPEHVAAYYLMGNVHHEAGDYDMAIESFTKVLQLETNAIALFNRGNAFYKKQDYDLSMADYNKALLLDPKYVDARYSRGGILYKNGRYKEAIEEMNEIIKLNPRYINAYICRAACLTNIKEYQKAISDYEKAIELNPSLYQIYLPIAVLHEQTGNKDKAEEVYKIFSSNPTKQPPLVLISEDNSEIMSIKKRLNELPPRHPAVTKQEQKKAAPLAEYFKKDFPEYFSASKQIEMMINANHSASKKLQSYNLNFIKHCDFNSRTQFLSVYMPNSTYPDRITICLMIAEEATKIINRISKGTTVASAQYDDRMTEISDLRFTGRIYIYHDVHLTADEMDRLRVFYKQKKLDPIFRGTTYLSQRFFIEKATKNSTSTDK